MPAKIRVLVLDDDPFVRSALHWLLAQAKDLQLVGETANVADLPELCRQAAPHVLLMGGVKRH